MVDRLFQIVYLLIEKQQMTAKEMAKLFEVSERTIYRDVEKLSIAGIPIYANQGRNGGISILPDYVLDKSVLTADEKEKILESLNVIDEVTFSGYNESIAKLRSFLGKENQDWIEIEFSSWGNGEKESETFAQIKEAIVTHSYMEIVYAGNQGSLTKRRMKPLKLCFKKQDWYLYAYCCLREDYRFFKLRRIVQITVTDTHFEPEAVGKILTKASKEYTKDIAAAIKVDLEIDPQMAFRAYEELADISVNDNGKLLCTVDVTDIEWFIGYILSYGSYIRILEPLYMKEKVMQEIEKMRKLY